MEKTLEQILTETPEDRRLFERERAYMEAYMLIIKLMDEQKVNKAELARRLGRTRAYVTKLLDGSTNMTIRTISDVLFHLGCRLEVTWSALDASAVEPSQPATELRKTTYQQLESRLTKPVWVAKEPRPRACGRGVAQLPQRMAG